MATPAAETASWRAAGAGHIELPLQEVLLSVIFERHSTWLKTILFGYADSSYYAAVGVASRSMVSR
jgi:hypothetical protein